MNIFLILTSLINMYQVVWKNTFIDIPLNYDTYQYYDLPKAYLYYNDVLLESEVIYEKGINHTSLNVVNSKHVKTFKIDYRVTFVEYNIKSTQTIYFNIIDNIAPEILYIPEIKMPVKEKRLTEKEIISNLIYQDNYYDKTDLIVKVNNLASVDINTPGMYLLEYQVMDPSYNITKKEGYYIVENNIPPVIKYKDIIQINYNEPFNYLNHFQFIDNYDKNLKTSVDISNVDFTKLGIYQITVSATNKDNLTTTVSAYIEIIDNIKPTIILKQNNTINVYDYNENYLKELIVDVYDNYDLLNIDDVIIEGYIDFNLIGKYEVTYKVSDTSNNETNKKIIIEIKDLEKPNIELIDSIEISVFTKQVNYLKYFNIYDNFNSFEDLIININDKNINLNLIGNYLLTIDVTDLNKNKITKTVEVSVIDNEIPEVIQMEEIIITDFTKKNDLYFKNFFSITDNYSSYLDINTKIIGNINYNKIGVYDIIIEFIDSSNNINRVNTSVYIADINSPYLKLNTNKYYYYLNDPKVNLNSFIEDYHDNYTNKDNLIIEIIDNINYEVTGLYEVIYKIKDESNNETFKVLNFYVDKRKEELIKGSNINLKVNDIYVIGSNIEFSSDVIKYNYYPKIIDTSSPGIKEILYVAYDSRGNTEEFVQKIIVEDMFNIMDYKINIIVNIVGILLIMGYILYSKNNGYKF